MIALGENLGYESSSSSKWRNRVVILIPCFSFYRLLAVPTRWLLSSAIDLPCTPLTMDGCQTTAPDVSRTPLTSSTTVRRQGHTHARTHTHVRAHTHHFFINFVHD